ncbi:MAG: hypothetical protein HY832_00805, partial [Candidatus Aenigmarchaeota archaeon]|nr:hypothetical protein [Candidatus Aenigmarchaeota archaeon]
MRFKRQNIILFTIVVAVLLAGVYLTTPQQLELVDATGSAIPLSHVVVNATEYVSFSINDSTVLLMVSNPSRATVAVQSIKQTQLSTGTIYTDVIGASNLVVNTAMIKLRKTGSVNAIVACDQFDVATSSCPEWKKTAIPFTQDDNYIYFSVSHFSAYAGADLTIINVQSYPRIGGIWNVAFTTTNSADLTISASNGTTYAEIPDNAATRDDLAFVELLCGNATVPVQERFDARTGKLQSVFAANYSCGTMSTQRVRALTPGKHTQQFIYGNDTEYAFNQAGNITISIGLSSNPVNTSATINISGVANWSDGGVVANTNLNLTFNGVLLINTSAGLTTITGQNWFNPSLMYRCKITVNNTASAQRDLQVALNASLLSASGCTNILSAARTSFFVTDNASTNVTYKIEDWMNPEHEDQFIYKIDADNTLNTKTATNFTSINKTWVFGTQSTRFGFNDSTGLNSADRSVSDTIHTDFIWASTKNATLSLNVSDANGLNPNNYSLVIEIYDSTTAHPLGTIFAEGQQIYAGTASNPAGTVVMVKATVNVTDGILDIDFHSATLGGSSLWMFNGLTLSVPRGNGNTATVEPEDEMYFNATVPASSTRDYYIYYNNSGSSGATGTYAYTPTYSGLYDFGTNTSNVMTEYTKESNQSEWNGTSGFQGTFLTLINSRDRGTANDLLRDFVFGINYNATFGMNLSNDMYIFNLTTFDQTNNQILANGIGSIYFLNTTQMRTNQTILMQTEFTALSQQRVTNNYGEFQLREQLDASLVLEWVLNGVSAYPIWDSTLMTFAGEQLTQTNATGGYQYSFTVPATHGDYNISANLTSNAVYGNNTVVLTVINGPPSVTTPYITPQNAIWSDTLNGSSVVTDPTADATTVYFRWYKNNNNIFNRTFTNVANGTNVTGLLTSGNFTHGDQIKLEVFANDGANDAIYKNSSAVTIQQVQITVELNVSMVNISQNVRISGFANLTNGTVVANNEINLTFNNARLYVNETTGLLQNTTTANLTQTNATGHYNYTYTVPSVTGTYTITVNTSTAQDVYGNTSTVLTVIN